MSEAGIDNIICFIVEKFLISLFKHKNIWELETRSQVEGQGDN